MIQTPLRSIAVATICILVGACSTPAPPYTPRMETVQVLADGGDSKVKVGRFDSSEKLDHIGLRAESMHSGVGDSFGAYLADAIRQDFSLANRIDPGSEIEIGMSVPSASR